MRFKIEDILRASAPSWSAIILRVAVLASLLGGLLTIGSPASAAPPQMHFGAIAYSETDEISRPHWLILDSMRSGQRFTSAGRRVEMPARPSFGFKTTGGRSL
jgi:hypothetical protein